MKMNELPQDWGGDSLTEFFDKARKSSFAAFQGMPSEFKKLIDINNCFFDAEKYMYNCRINRLTLLSFFRAHSSFLGAVRLAIATQIPESYMVMRGLMEWSLNGLYLHRKPDLSFTWLNRHNNKKEIRNIFKIGSMLSELKEIDSRLEKKVRNIYEWCIDWGAHPNEYAISAFYEEKKVDNTYEFKINILTNDKPIIKSCLKYCAVAGILSLKILELIMPERFQLTGLSTKLNGISKAIKL
jgi:hypothetical protein